MVDKLIWTLPRPRPPYYKGGFPLHFEKKLIKELNNPNKILHPFGGMAEYGTRLDISPSVLPDTVADAHCLPFDSNVFDLVIVDPPYNDKLAKDLYKTPKLRMMTYIRESVRVCKPNGFVALYHWIWVPRPKLTSYHLMIAILTRQWHSPRVCIVYKKEYS